MTEAVPPEIYGTVSIVLGLVVLGRSQFSLPFAMAAMRQYAEAARRDDVGMLRRVVRYWLIRSQGIAAALVLLVGVPYCLCQSISLWLPVLTFGLFVVDSEIMMEAAFLNASKQHRALFAVTRSGGLDSTHPRGGFGASARVLRPQWSWSATLWAG